VNGNATSDGNQNLSDKLDKSAGVIKPAEEVDPQIVQPAPVPDPNSTTVIPPAGTPGGPPGPERPGAVTASSELAGPKDDVPRRSSLAPARAPRAKFSSKGNTIAVSASPSSRVGTLVKTRPPPSRKGRKSS
jgi:hypothetical protein